MKKSELKQIIKEEYSKILKEGGRFEATKKSKYDVTPKVQVMTGGPTDRFKGPYVVIWLNGGGYIEIQTKTELSNKQAQMIANYLVVGIDKLLSAIK